MENNRDMRRYLDVDCGCDVSILHGCNVGIVLLPLCLSQCRLAAVQCTLGKMHVS